MVQLQRRRLILLLAVLLAGSTVIPADSREQSDEPCGLTPSHLMIARSEDVLILSAGTTQVLPTSLTANQAAFLSAALPYDHWLATQDWQVVRTSLPHAYLIELRSVETGRLELSATFDRRIELAMSVVSPSSRQVAFIQANNLASEVTLMDAESATRRTVLIRHDAPLAAYAIQAAFSPDESCLAISMERSGGSGPETWLVDLATGEVSDRIAGDLVGWLPGR